MEGPDQEWGTQYLQWDLCAIMGARHLQGGWDWPSVSTFCSLPTAVRSQWQKWLGLELGGHDILRCRPQLIPWLAQQLPYGAQLSTENVP